MSEQTFFLYLALGSTFFFIIKIIMLFFIGDSGEDFDSALSDADSQQSFSVFSLQSMLAFLMGSSWVYLAARYEWGYTSGLSLVVGSLFGTLSVFRTNTIEQVSLFDLSLFSLLFFFAQSGNVNFSS